MIDTQSLKNKILDLAIQGKLTRQLPEDGTAEELYEKIQVEKQALVEAGKIKKEKPLKEIEEGEVPFEIPENWKWVKLSEISYLTSGGQYEETKEGIPYVKVADLNSNENKFEIIKSSRYVDKGNTGIIPKGSIIFPKRGGAIATNKKRLVNKTEIYVDTNIMGMTIIYPPIMNFIKIWFDSIDLGALQSGTSVPQINNKDLYPLLIPLPPLGEQKRIVEIVKNIFNEIDTIEKLQTQYAADAEILKSKLIDAAIQGKLTEQLPSDGTAEELYDQIQTEKQALISAGKIKKEKPLKEIDESEIPFEIPESWKWVRISDVIDVRDGTHDSPKYQEEGIPLITSKNISSGELTFDDVKLISEKDANKINERSYVDDGDILFAMIGSIGNPVIVHKDKEFCIKNVALFKNHASKSINRNYIHLFLMHEQNVLRKNAIGGLQPFVSLKVLRNHLMPLPPLAEQKRIVERLEELLDCCKQK